MRRIAAVQVIAAAMSEALLQMGVQQQKCGQILSEGRKMDEQVKMQEREEQKREPDFGKTETQKRELVSGKQETQKRESDSGKQEMRKKKTAGRPMNYNEQMSGYGRADGIRMLQSENMRAGEIQSLTPRRPGRQRAEGTVRPDAKNQKSEAALRLGAGQRKKEDQEENGSAGQRRGREYARGRASVSIPEKRRREQEQESRMRFLTGALCVLVVLLIVAIVWEIVLGHGVRETGSERIAAKKQEKQQMMSESLKKEQKAGADLKIQSGADGQGAEGVQTGADGQDAEGMQSEIDGQDADTAPEAGDFSARIKLEGMTVAEQAERLAMQYDYDRAIRLLENAEEYGENAEYQAAAAKYQKQKEACVPYPAEEVTHVFFHTLIHDASKAFDGDEYEAGYNQFMVTEFEFNSIIQQMYDRGYVMVYLSDFTEKTTDAAGNSVFRAHDIMLPSGKIPFVLSQDDVSYYHYMDGDGFASRLIVDENGDVKNEYIEDDGSISVGDYDMVPLIDRFVEKHPDFSYQGAKGYVALTGYEGILGYRTDEVYKTKQADRITVQQQQFFDSYPGGFDEEAFEQECAAAKKVAEAMKANGWRFASHTWGHQNLSETNGISYDKFVRDTDRWETWVEPLIGDTDTIIYAFGGDIQGWENYSGERYNYLKQAGFDYFCGVDSAKYWVQVTDDYVRQSRRNIDGYRMYYDPEMLSDLFDVSQAWDPLRPSSVPQI